MSVSFESSVLSVRGLCDGTITVPKWVLPSVVCLSVNWKTKRSGGLGPRGLSSHKTIGTLMEWYWQGNPEVMVQTLALEQLCPQHILDGMASNRTKELRGERPASDHLTHGTAHYSHSMYPTPWAIIFIHIIEIKTVSFITAPTMTSLSHSKPASAATFLDSPSVYHCDERCSLYSRLRTCFLWWRPKFRVWCTGTLVTNEVMLFSS
jgi:hypothetical protein